MIGKQLGVVRRRGWRPSGRPARHSFSAHFAAKDETLPKSVDHAPTAPAIFDQGNVGSCWAHSTSRQVSSAMTILGKPLGFVPSPDDLYRIARAMMRAQFNGGRGALTDSGTDPSVGMQVLSLFGVRAMRGPTSDGRNSDCAEATVNDEPNLADLVQDAKHVLVGDYGITSAHAQRVLDLKRALVHRPVTLGFFCDTAFENWRKGDAPYGAPKNPNDPEGGGHDVAVDGYDTLSNGKTVFIIANSWGTEWGDHGRILVSEDFITDQQVSDIYVIDEVPQ